METGRSFPLRIPLSLQHQRIWTLSPLGLSFRPCFLLLRLYLHLWNRLHPAKRAPCTRGACCVLCGEGSGGRSKPVLQHKVVPREQTPLRDKPLFHSCQGTAFRSSAFIAFGVRWIWVSLCWAQGGDFLWRNNSTAASSVIHCVSCQMLWINMKQAGTVILSSFCPRTSLLPSGLCSKTFWKRRLAKPAQAPAAHACSGLWERLSSHDPGAGHLLHNSCKYLFRACTYCMHCLTGSYGTEAEMKMLPALPQRMQHTLCYWPWLRVFLHKNRDQRAAATGVYPCRKDVTLELSLLLSFLSFSHMKEAPVGQRSAWLIRSLSLEHEQKRTVYGHWKQGHVTQKDHRDAICCCREKILVDKGQLEFR